MSSESRAKVAPPPKKSTFLPEQTKPVEAADNMKATKLVGMTFNMDRDWHTKFKMTAVSRGIDMKELLIESFAAWEREQKGK